MTLLQFARFYLDGERLRVRMPPQALRVHPGGFELVLYRDPPFQAALIVLGPGKVPPHRHPRVTSIDVELAGDGEIRVGRHRSRKIAPDAAKALDSLVLVPAGIEHSGESFTGVAWLSLQRWDREPMGFITDDWEGEEWAMRARPQAAKR